MRVPFNSIHQKDGKTLTAYGFACGYVQENKSKSMRLYMEFQTYHVQGFLNGVHVWETFNLLSDARNFFKSLK